MKSIINKLPFYAFTLLVGIACIMGFFAPFNFLTVSTCSIWFLFIIFLGTLNPIILIITLVYGLIFISCIFWCLNTNKIARAYKMFIVLLAFDSLIYIATVFFEIFSFDFSAFTVILTRALCLLFTIIWYKLKVNRNSKLDDDSHMLINKKIFCAMKYTAIGIMLVKLLGTVIYSSIGKFFMFPLSVISLTVSSIIPLESKESLFWDVFSYFIGIVFLINLLCIILLLKKRKVEKLFWVTFLIISASDLICSQYIYPKPIKLISIIVAFLILIIGLVASLFMNENKKAMDGRTVLNH